MIPLWFSHAIIFIALVVGSITDFKKREVPDFLSFSLMGIGIAIGALNSIGINSIMPVIGSIIGLICGYLLGALMFYTGQWGGGDAKILMGIGAVLGINISYFWISSVELPLFFTVVLTILIAGTVYGLSYGIYLIFKNFKSFKKAFKERIHKPTVIKVRMGITFVVIALIIWSFFIHLQALRWLTIFFAFFIFGGFYLVIIGKLIEHVCMIKPMKVKDLTEGEWIAKDVIVKGKYICGPKDLGITTKQIALLKKLKIRSVIIKEGIPFIPGFLLGYIFILLYGNWMLQIIGIF